MKIHIEFKDDATKEIIDDGLKELQNTWLASIVISEGLIVEIYNFRGSLSPERLQTRIFKNQIKSLYIYGSR